MNPVNREEPVLIQHWADSLGESLSALFDGNQTEADIRDILKAMDTEAGQAEIRKVIGDFAGVEQALRRGTLARSHTDVSVAVRELIRARRLEADATASVHWTQPLRDLFGLPGHYLVRGLTGTLAVAIAFVAFNITAEWRYSLSPQARQDAETRAMQRELREVLRRDNLFAAQKAPASQLPPGPAALASQLEAQAVLDVPATTPRPLWSPAEEQVEEVPASQQR